jgi:type II secretory pathway pseudopilin PulG
MFNRNHQAGVTLIETLIGLALSLIVTSAMVALMGASMGSATKIIQMSQLTDELRNSMSMMSRDIRRANFNANSIYCYANSKCGISGGVAAQAADIGITGSCFIFGLDRDWDGNSNNDGGGGFRLAASGGVGVIEMWTGTTVPSCAAVSTDWMPITDPDFVDIRAFDLDTTGSFQDSILQEDGTTLTLRTRQLNMQLEGRLILNNAITRRVEDTIKVRNDLFL